MPQADQEVGGVPDARKVIAEDGGCVRHLLDLPIDEHERLTGPLECVECGIRSLVRQRQQEAVDAALPELVDVGGIEARIIDRVGKRHRVPGTPKGDLGTERDL